MNAMKTKLFSLTALVKTASMALFQPVVVIIVNLNLEGTKGSIEHFWRFLKMEEWWKITIKMEQLPIGWMEKNIFIAIDSIKCRKIIRIIQLDKF